jgi:hypothetical protein
MLFQLKRNTYRWAVCAFGLSLILAVIVMTGCGGKGPGSALAGLGSGGLKAGSAAISLDNPGSLQLRIGDDPSTPDDRIMALRLDITALRAWNSSTSDSIDFLTDPVSVELVHSSTITVPIAQTGANPNTSYDRVDISCSGAGLTYMDYPSGALYNQELGALSTITVDLTNFPLTLGTAPLIVDVNVNVPSLVILPPAGNVRQPVLRGLAPRPRASGATTGSSPGVTVTQSSIQTGQQQPEGGQVQYLYGTVTKTVGSTLTVKTSSNSTFKFQTDANTNFEDVTLGTVLNGIVEANGSTQADGSFYADEIELVDVSNGVEFLGMVSSVAPDMELSMVVQDGIGSGMTSTLVGKSVTSQLDQASYEVSTGDNDMTGVTAVFDGEHIFPGQQVEVEAFTGMQADPEGSAGLTVPYMVELVQQTISGTAMNYVAGGSPGTGTFDLVLPSNGSSPLVTLNPGLTSVHVYQQRTTFPTISSIANNRAVQVRGLLLCQNDNVGQACTNFVMVAARITLNN